MRERMKEMAHRRALLDRREAFEGTLIEAAGAKIDLDALGQSRLRVEPLGPARGPANAPVTIVEFADFQEPAASQGATLAREAVKAYPDRVRLVFRQNPSANHPDAARAAEASLCASDQGKFWEYHDLLLEHPEALAVPDLKRYAAELSMSGATFGECVDARRHRAEVDADVSAATTSQIHGNPAFVVNGILVSGAMPWTEFRRLIDQELAKGQAVVTASR
jgi:protein-disulfide isomerase